MRKFSISGYTTTFNCFEMEYPFEECIESLLGFCDQVAIVDAGSSDGTIEAIEKIAAREKRIKFEVSKVDFTHPRWAIHQDGYLKAKARALCQADYCWQSDSDEIVAEHDYIKMNYLPNLLGEYNVMMLPIIEFWGDFSKIRSDAFSWKPRFSRNLSGITHGIPTRYKMLDSSGCEYPKPYFSDSCNYIDQATQVDQKILIPLGLSLEHISKIDQTSFEELFLQAVHELPSVYHVSWLDLERKIRHYKRFWQTFHASMYNINFVDNAENNVMFDKPWSQVSDQDIKIKAQQLNQIGPRSFHYKINPEVIGYTLTYQGAVPSCLVAWAENLKQSKTKTDKAVESRFNQEKLYTEATSLLL